jgi:D-alanyl-D-alanine dipeptidase
MANSYSSGKKDFVTLRSIAPTILYSIKYFSSHNFLGRVVKGYKKAECYLEKNAAKALAKVQKDARKAGYSLIIYDCYRPQRAVDDFVAWVKDLNDKKMKKEFYPDINKDKLFELGYIAKKSGHSRGSTVDLSIIRLGNGIKPYQDQLLDCRSADKFNDGSLDMGTTFDCFDELSHTMNPKVSSKALTNRLKLKSLMEKHGFENYSKEWWHYTFKNEKFKKTYFDFEVE